MPTELRVFGDLKVLRLDKAFTFEDLDGTKETYAISSFSTSKKLAQVSRAEEWCALGTVYFMLGEVRTNDYVRLDIGPDGKYDLYIRGFESILAKLTKKQAEDLLNFLLNRDLDIRIVEIADEDSGKASFYIQRCSDERYLVAFNLWTTKPEGAASWTNPVGPTRAAEEAGFKVLEEETSEETETVAEAQPVC